MPFAEPWVDLEAVIQSEVSQKEKNKCCIMFIKCGIKKMVEMNLFAMQK